MIEVNNLTKAKISSRYIQEVLSQALNILKKQIDISVAIVSSRRIKELNKKYRQINRITDVLSFDELNEIIICYQQTRRQARQVKHSLSREIGLLLVHGLLHLLGYNHRTERERNKMQKLTNKIVSKLAS